MHDGELILVAGALLAAGLMASLVAGRLRVPGLLLVLGLGMAIGSDGTGWIAFDDYELARSVGIVALALILFEGGLAVGLHEIRPVLGVSLSLALLGTVVTAVVCGVAATLLFDLSNLEGMLVGSIVAATDGAAVFAVLRGSTLRRRLAQTLEGEAGFNDPVAVLLVLGFIEWIQRPDYGVVDLLVLSGQQLGIGIAAGAVVGYGAVRAFQALRLATPGLYPVASLATAALAFGAADAVHGSGFAAAYLAGLVLGSSRIPARMTVIAFHQGLAWVAQVVMFLTLGLLVFPGELADVIVEGTVLAIVLAFVARPLATLVATAFSSFSTAEKTILGWAGLRGAVPVVLATFPVIEGIDRSEEFFNIVFFAVLLSTLLQGGTVEPLARRLGLTTSEPALPTPLVEIGMIRELGADVVEYAVAHGDAAVGKRIRDLGLPREALVSVLVRADQALLPRGSTTIDSGDRLHVLVRREAVDEVRALADRWRMGPVGPPARPPRPVRGRPPITSLRPWSEADGDPARPAIVNGQTVVDRLLVRRDAPGALVVLEDGRYAVTGSLLAVGSRRAVSDVARRRLADAANDSERAWWQEVIGACAA